MQGPDDSPRPRRLQIYLPASLRRRPRWRVLIPGFVTAVAAASVVVTAWVLGDRFDRRVESGFDPSRAIAAAIDRETAERLHVRADSLGRRAEELEEAALDPGLPEATAEMHRKRAQMVAQASAKLRERASSGDAMLATREARRIVWIYSVCLDLLVCTAASLIALAVALQVLRLLVRENRVTPGFVAAVLAADAVLSAAVYLWFRKVWYDYETEPFVLIREAISPDVLSLMRFDDGFHVATITLFLVACTLVLAFPKLPPSGERDPEGADPAVVGRAARDIAQSMRVIRWILYVGAAMVVVYVATMTAVFQWAMTYVDLTRADLRAGVDALTQSAVTARSLLASALLVSIYVPTTFTLRLMASDLAARALPEGSFPEREKWMEERGIAAAGATQHVKTIAAVLSPVIAGPIASFLQGAVT
jgi:hypothetical protein